MAGLSAGADRWVRRGDPAAGAFTVFHYRGERLLAADSVNAAREHLAARKLLDAGVWPAPALLADPATDLAALAAPSGPDSAAAGPPPLSRP